MKPEIIDKQPLIREVISSTDFDYNKLAIKRRIFLLTRDFKNYLVSAFLTESIDKLRSWSVDTALPAGDFLGFPEQLSLMVSEFYDFLYDYFYTEEAFKSLVRENCKALKDLFFNYLKKPQMLPVDRHNRPLVRRVCDFLANHTDRSVLMLRKSFFA